MRQLITAIYCFRNNSGLWSYFKRLLNWNSIGDDRIFIQENSNITYITIQHDSARKWENQMACSMAQFVCYVQKCSTSPLRSPLYLGFLCFACIFMNSESCCQPFEMVLQSMFVLFYVALLQMNCSGRFEFHVAPLYSKLFAYSCQIRAFYFFLVLLTYGNIYQNPKSDMATHRCFSQTIG